MDNVIDSLTYDPWPQLELADSIRVAARRRLNERARKIVGLWFQGYTYEWIGRAIGLSRERIRQIVLKSLNDLARDRAIRRLHGYRWYVVACECGWRSITRLTERDARKEADGHMCRSNFVTVDGIDPCLAAYIRKMFKWGDEHMVTHEAARQV